MRLCIEYWQVYAKLGIGSEYKPIAILMMRRIFGIHSSQVTMNEKKFVQVKMIRVFKKKKVQFWLMGKRKESQNETTRDFVGKSFI